MIETIHYNTNVFNFRNLFENCLGELESIHKNFDIVEVEELTGGGVCDPVENTQYGLIEKLFQEVVHQHQFQDMWNDFCKTVIKFYFDNDKILVQKLPSIKIFPSKHNWKFVENIDYVDERPVNFHYEYEHPFHHPMFELNFIVPLIDMDDHNGIFVDKTYFSPNYGDVLIFDQLEHGGYVKNESSNTRVSIDFKALKYKNYDSSLLSDTIMVKKRGKWMPQKEVFNTEYYYKEL